MPRRGRKPVPTEVKKARKTARSDRINADEIQLDTVDAIPVPPDILNEDGKELWYVFCNQAHKIGLLHSIAYPQIVDYCLQWQIYLYNAGIISESSTPGTAVYNDGKTHGLASQYKAMIAARKEMIAFESNWGLNPSSKTRIVSSGSTGSPKGKSRFDL